MCSTNTSNYISPQVQRILIQWDDQNNCVAGSHLFAEIKTYSSLLFWSVPPENQLLRKSPLVGCCSPLYLAVKSTSSKCLIPAAKPKKNLLEEKWGIVSADLQQFAQNMDSQCLLWALLSGKTQQTSAYDTIGLDVLFRKDTAASSLQPQHK